VRFIVEREHILSALAFVTKYAAKDNNGIPVLANVRLVAAAGAVTVTSTDIERAASDTFKAEVGEEGSACVPARLLLGAVKGANGADVFFDAGDRQATVKAGKSQIKMPILPAGDFPPMPMLDTDAAHNFMLAAGTLARLKKEVSFAVEEKGGRFFLTGTSWRIAGDNLEFCATNGKKFSLLSISTPRDAVGTPDIIVPEFDMPAWDDGEVEVSVDAAFIRFTLGNQVVASKLIEAHSPTTASSSRSTVPRSCSTAPSCWPRSIAWRLSPRFANTQSCLSAAMALPPFPPRLRSAKPATRSPTTARIFRPPSCIRWRRMSCPASIARPSNGVGATTPPASPCTSLRAPNVSPS
jgi:DNA polymerase III sliding clamp (beta) subunit (PCNA family)